MSTTILNAITSAAETYTGIERHFADWTLSPMDEEVPTEAFKLLSPVITIDDIEQYAISLYYGRTAVLRTVTADGDQLHHVVKNLPSEALQTIYNALQ